MGKACVGRALVRRKGAISQAEARRLLGDPDTREEEARNVWMDGRCARQRTAWWRSEQVAAGLSGRPFVPKQETVQRWTRKVLVLGQAPFPWVPVPGHRCRVGAESQVQGAFRQPAGDHPDLMVPRWGRKTTRQQKKKAIEVQMPPRLQKTLG